MNSSEELAYWYLRLNGFFPLTNFVVHKTSRTKYRADVDLLAIRPPYVYEEIGGQEHDLDDLLKQALNLKQMVALIVDVKSGRYDAQKLFRPEYVEYTVHRLGVTADTQSVLDQLSVNWIAETVEGVMIAKVFASRVERDDNVSALSIPLEHIAILNEL